MTADEIDSYFKIKGWQYLKRADTIWQIGLRSRIKDYRRDFDIHFVLLDDWLYISVPVLPTSVINISCWHHFINYLICLNFHLFLAKLTIHDNHVWLMVEIPSRGKLADIDEAVMSINTYVQTYYLDIETMATCPKTAELVNIQILNESNDLDQKTPESTSDVIIEN